MSAMSTVGDKNQLNLLTSKGEWEKVVKLYEEKPGMWSIMISNSNNTALHMAINDEREDIVKRLMGIIIHADAHTLEKKEIKEALSIVNEGGDTPLHRAATIGSVRMCDCILTAGNRINKDLLSINNKWGQTPMFVVALQNRKDAFIFLYNAATVAYSRDSRDKPYQLLRNTVNGDTVLHATIRRDHYDLAFHIIQQCSDLLDKFNENGETPLHVLASKPSAFKSGYHLSWWQSIIYHCIYVDPLKYDPHPPIGAPDPRSSRQNCPEGDPENPNIFHIKGNVPHNYATCFEFLAITFRIFFGVTGFGKTSDGIMKARQKHRWSVQILDELMKKPAEVYMKDGNNPGFELSGLERPLEFDIKRREGDGNKTDTALLVAAQNGVLEVVNKILQELPMSIHDTSSRNKNILMVTVEKRQPTILEALHRRLESNKPKLWEDLIQAVDTEDNIILHLAAKYDKSLSHPWHIHGSAMQMQWEIKWYQYVKSFPPHHFVFFTNKKGETPGQIFTRDHEGLVESGGVWLKETAESCSVVAALLAGVSFATSSSVPGGTDDQIGKPTLEGQPAFELFAITVLIGLCFSVTALIMFLSIVTSRKQSKDFKKNLPLKLLLGLSSLFVSIGSMLISFCAAYFFVLEDQFKKAVFPLYAATCLPASFYAVAQFPLYVDLLKAIFTKVPHSLHYADV